MVKRGLADRKREYDGNLKDRDCQTFSLAHSDPEKVLRMPSKRYTYLDIMYMYHYSYATCI